jgi:hypothetical protein
VIERQTHRSVAVDYLSDDDFDSDGWYGYQLGYDGHEADHAEDTTWEERADTDRWYLPADVLDQPAEALADPVPADADDAPRQAGDHDDSATWETRLSGISTWDFKVSGKRSRYPSKRLGIGLALVAIAAVVAVLVAAVVTVTRSPVPATDESNAPQPSSSAAPAPSSAPTMSSAPSPAPPPPPALPPPPVSAEQITTAPPVVRQQTGGNQSRQTAPTQKKPQMDVTRTPISVGAPPPPPSANDSSTPGDSQKPRRRGFW